MRQWFMTAQNLLTSLTSFDKDGYLISYNEFIKLQPFNIVFVEFDEFIITY